MISEEGRVYKALAAPSDRLLRNGLLGLALVSSRESQAFCKLRKATDGDAGSRLGGQDKMSEIQRDVTVFGWIEISFDWHGPRNTQFDGNPNNR